jgi:membrane dipeptidase
MFLGTAGTKLGVAGASGHEFEAHFGSPGSLGLGFADEDENDYFGYDERYYPVCRGRGRSGSRGGTAPAISPPALRRRGFSDDDVAGIIGENFMRAFAQTWSG